MFLALYPGIFVGIHGLFRCEAGAQPSKQKGVRGALAYWVFITTTFLVIKFESQTGLTILESRARWPRSSPTARASYQVNQAAFRGSGFA